MVKETDTEALYTGLLTNPDVIATFVVNNNMPAVVDRLRALGFICNVPQDCFTAFNVLLQDGRKNEFLQAINVPCIVPPDSATAILALKAGRAHVEAARAMRGPGGAKAADSLFTWGDQDVTLSNLFLALGTGLLTLTTAQPQTVNPVADASMDAAKREAEAAAAAAAKSRTNWIIGGVLALIAIAVLYSIYKKRKGAAA